MTHYWINTAFIAGIMLPAAGVADIIKLPGHNAEIVTLNDEPSRGMTKLRVEQRYGEPEMRMQAVGEPPISRWDYPSYSVYFEGNQVLHAVAHQTQATPLQTPQ